MKIPFERIPVPTLEDLAHAERQQEWRAQSVRKLTEERTRRRRWLESDETKETVRRARDAYEELDDPGVEFRLRSPFIALADLRPAAQPDGQEDPDEISVAERRRRDWATRPPLTRLAMRKSHALATYLALVYATQADPGAVKPGWTNRRGNVNKNGGRAPWSVVSGRWANSPRARRMRLNRDLDDLARADLIQLGGHKEQGRYEGFTLLSDNGSGVTYKVPGKSHSWPDVVTLPGDFVRRGWSVVLSTAELATLLVARHASVTLPRAPGQPGVGIPRSTRDRRYGLSGEAYEAVHELAEFGLLEVHDPMPQRRGGRLRQQPPEVRAAQGAEGEGLAAVPYQLAVPDDSVFARPALETVQACLQVNSAPPRVG
ncbi:MULTISPECIES: hypothetical protein [unclassified Modestobacter]|uniref:hypothetical protein n=1 Tax=unclassified Modestobacter TaxID=2643866 RepID=UPI0022AA07CB|nr:MULTISPECIES: hypothetical protein [unclassified Modestobacter]MCZ2825994.1 hypothetical protein [Modestobacter sp. VKM Ac-2981]MCZ2852941.1 hypothetical protein [Modestobacter sp. VKM Ac-2982]